MGRRRMANGLKTWSLLKVLIRRLYWTITGLIDLHPKNINKSVNVTKVTDATYFHKQHTQYFYLFKHWRILLFLFQTYTYSDGDLTFS